MSWLDWHYEVKGLDKNAIGNALRVRGLDSTWTRFRSFDTLRLELRPDHGWLGAAGAMFHRLRLRQGRGTSVQRNN